MRRLLTLILSLVCCIAVKAQDIHFSHPHANPLLLNPAMTGLFDADMRLIADFRAQWQSVGTNYRTMYASVDMKTPAFFRRSSAMGIGLELYSDVAGDLDFRNYGVHLTLSGLKTLDGYQGRKMITVAGKFGVIGQSVDYSKIIAFEEEPAIMNGIDNNILKMDWSLGLGWFHEMKLKGHVYYLGFSSAHINRPDVNFGLYDQGAAESLHRRHIFHGGADFKISESMNIMPSAVFVDQGPHREIVIGTFWRFKSIAPNLKKKDLAVYLGAWGRWYFEFDGLSGFDAIVAAVRLNYQKTSFTFSYDINTSSLALASLGRGGPEFSVVQLVDWKNNPHRRVRCPALSW